jgi:hypothetical protein
LVFHLSPPWERVHEGPGEAMFDLLATTAPIHIQPCCLTRYTMLGA